MLLTEVCNSLYHVAPERLLLFNNHALVILFSFLFLGHNKFSLVSVALHLLLPVPEVFLSAFAWPFFYHLSIISLNVRKPSPDHLVV